MRTGIAVIVQGGLSGSFESDGESSGPGPAGAGWFGYADILRRVEEPSRLGSWSYEVHDAKLSRATRGGTILQLCAYSELVGAIQGHVPEFFRVVTPDGRESYRFEEFAAFYRFVKAKFLAAVGFSHLERHTLQVEIYPDPVDHCEVCRWWERCNARRRSDDHLSFVAGLGRVQQTELESRDIDTLAALAGIPVPIEFKPKHGSRETYQRLREQARLQAESREKHEPIYELLPPERSMPEAVPTNRGLARLPEPSPGDLFLDLEGDPYVRDGGREYLFGLGRSDGHGVFFYTPFWAFDDASERTAFEAVVDDIMTTLTAEPTIHIYHYSAYEPAAFKRLMGRYASREDVIDTLLRSGRFVDLYGAVKHTLRAGVESYSIKNMEPFYEFTREVALENASCQRRVVEAALAAGMNDFTELAPEVFAAIEGYNKDDCRSTLELRNWLEGLRAELIARGAEVPRPEVKIGEASEKLSERQLRVEGLRARLLAGLQVEALSSPEERGRYLLAYMLDWHRRESKADWWDYYRLIELTEEELLDEPAALAGLQHVHRESDVRNKRTGKPTGSVIDRYRYPAQEMEIRVGAELKTQDAMKWGEVVAVDRQNLMIDIKKGKSLEAKHPTAVFEHKYVKVDVLEDAIYRLATDVADAGSIQECHLPLVRNLLLRNRPSALIPELGVSQASSEAAIDHAVHLVVEMDGDVLAIQGPPGSGKTFLGAKMICSLVDAGKRVGVTATSHKVIRNLLDDVYEQRPAIRLAHKKNREEAEEDLDPNGTQCGSDPVSEIVECYDNAKVLRALTDGDIDVLGGTSWLWARPEFATLVDVLLVDEAGQMSLANVLAVAQSAKSLVLLGDPQQLEQPQKGSHPDGVAVSALEHILGQHKTMPAEHGIFLPVTRRLAPAVCAFTSEVFYEGKLSSKPGLERQALRGSGSADLDGAGLRVVEVSHDGCRNASDEEAEVIARLVQRLLTPDLVWIDESGRANPMTPADILVVAPYNAHVSRLRERLRRFGVGRIGTVDKFQGQQAPVVIYSMATSRPEDAPRGMEFLYSLNRLNVATSRAKCLCILVANPCLFEPKCQTPRQMQLASALCRYREMAKNSMA